MNSQIEQEIIEALRLSGCGIVRRSVRQDALSKPPRLQTLLQAVALRTKVGLRDLKSPCRRQKTARARLIFYALARELRDVSYYEIGLAVGGRDHSTVIQGVEKVAKNRQRYEPELSELIATWGDTP